LSAGTNVTISDAGGNITISASASGSPSTFEYRASAVTSSMWIGSPYYVDTVFSSALASTNYIITITGEDVRSFTYENKTVNGFRINTNSSDVMTGTTLWYVTLYN
jgi:hypothetical protein